MVDRQAVRPEGNIFAKSWGKPRIRKRPGRGQGKTGKDGNFKGGQTEEIIAILSNLIIAIIRV